MITRRAFVAGSAATLTLPAPAVIAYPRPPAHDYARIDVSHQTGNAITVDMPPHWSMGDVIMIEGVNAISRFTPEVLFGLRQFVLTEHTRGIVLCIYPALIPIDTDRRRGTVNGPAMRGAKVYRLDPPRWGYL